MSHPTLVILAAGLSTRFGGSKQLEPVGPDGEALLDYAVFDALSSGFGSVALVVSRANEEDLAERFRGTFGTAVPLRTVVQTTGRLPGGIRPPDRRKPWGTGHAVLCLEGVVEGPFAVANADDFYGRSAYRTLVGHFRDPARSGEHCVIGYPLESALSAHGGVSRAACETDSEGHLTSIVELLDVRRGPDGAITGQTADGLGRRLSGAELVSMNLWGLRPSIFKVLAARFEAFLEARGTEPGAEFYLSDAIGEAVGEGQATVRVAPASEPWFGMTFPEDGELVRDRIGSLVTAGDYPRSLRAAMRVTDRRTADAT